MRDQRSRRICSLKAAVNLQLRNAAENSSLIMDLKVSSPRYELEPGPILLIFRSLGGDKLHNLDPGSTAYRDDGE
jgi:hypothetical protein